jgi:hypothetical protein
MATCSGRFGNTEFRRFRGAIRSAHSRMVTVARWAWPTLLCPARSLAVAVLIGALALVSGSATANAQSGGDYVITKGAIAGGGGTATGGDYVMSGTIGQHDADEPLAGGDYELSGGFWAGVDPTVLPPEIGDDTCVGGSNDGGSCSTGADCPGGVCGLKSRYISIAPPPEPGFDRTIQVCITTMPQYPARETECWWAGPQISISNGPNPSSAGAPLQCTTTPHAQEWTTAPLHLFGAAIIPGSDYEVTMCDDNGANCSAPLPAATGKWGDVATPFGGASQPNFGDVSSILDGFRGVVTALSTARLDLAGSGGSGQPNLPNQIVNFGDVSASLDAFRGLSYPFTVTPCP